jgi:hypothetical protein
MRYDRSTPAESLTDNPMHSFCPCTCRVPSHWPVWTSGFCDKRIREKRENNEENHIFFMGVNVFWKNKFKSNLGEKQRTSVLFKFYNDQRCILLHFADTEKYVYSIEGARLGKKTQIPYDKYDLRR